MPTTTFEFGDIVLVPFPFTDHSTVKRRPAVVVSSARYNRERTDLIVAAVTSQVRPSQTIGERLLGDWMAAGLIKRSVLKPLLSTVHSSLVVRRLGALSERDLKSLSAALREMLGSDADRPSHQAGLT
ncbi:MAG: type II toxin-antitoxin system PemK/MazF family toxin [Chloroflexota bacterium]